MQEIGDRGTDLTGTVFKPICILRHNFHDVRRLTLDRDRAWPGQDRTPVYACHLEWPAVNPHLCVAELANSGPGQYQNHLLAGLRAETLEHRRGVQAIRTIRADVRCCPCRQCPLRDHDADGPIQNPKLNPNRGPPERRSRPDRSGPRARREMPPMFGIGVAMSLEVGACPRRPFQSNRTR